MDILSLTVLSTAFLMGETIPETYTCVGDNISPALSWSEVPEKTESIAVISDDPDCPGGWTHWAIFNIPPDTQDLPEGIPPTPKLPDGSIQGITDFRRPGYGGPCPPPGKPHRYFFRIYALDTMLPLSIDATQEALEKAMQGHILAQGEIMGIVQR